MTKEEKKIKRTDEHISYVLDTSALLTLWNNEEGADIVERILRSGVLIYVSFMTFMEGRYRLWKNVGKGESDEFSKYLELLPVKRVNINDLIFEKSVEIKATNNLSVCDSWIIATAITTNSVLVHKDPEFEQVKKKIKLKTLPYKK
ncbi:MAG: PIN domain-containing protein [Thermodesulfovibrionia bacterium]|nr:PIN domain-containing protein [Thermodesulfovibrionia bacterium]